MDYVVFVSVRVFGLLYRFLILSKMPSYIVNGGEIPMRYFNDVQLALTFKVVGCGLSIRNLFDGLCDLVKPDEIVDLCKVDNNTFNFSVNRKEVADIVVSVRHIRVGDKVYPVVSILKQTVESKLH